MVVELDSEADDQRHILAYSCHSEQLQQNFFAVFNLKQKSTDMYVCVLFHYLAIAVASHAIEYFIVEVKALDPDNCYVLAHE